MIGDRLKLALVKRGMDQYELADMIYVSPSTISHYVNGQRGKKYASLVDICKALNVSADYLLGLSDEMEVQHDE